tara:strand:+ start:232 stop:525 length:294 start_codon:yes stop_codon:yes gene_type:complete
MKAEIKIEKTKEGTIYTLEGKGTFRIVEVGFCVFVLEKRFEDFTISGVFWHKINIIEQWKRIDNEGEETDDCLVERHYSLDYAIKWIHDYNKYPIYH